MPVRNQDIIGKLTLSLYDQLEHDAQEYEGEAVITAAIIVVDVQYPDGTSGVGFQSTDDRAWFQEALLDEAARVAREETE